MLMPSAFMIGPNNHKTCKFSLSSRIWLQTHSCKTCNFTKHFFKLMKHNMISSSLVRWNKGMNIQPAIPT